MQKRDVPLAIDDADLSARQADLTIALKHAASAAELEVEIEAALCRRRDVGGGAVNGMLGKQDPIDGTVAQLDRFDLGRKPRGRGGLRREIHEGLANRLAIVGKLLGGFCDVRIPDQMARRAAT